MRTTSASRTVVQTTPLDERFKAAFRRHPAGVAIVTADCGDGPAGLTATSIISVSADPAFLVFSLSAQSSATPTIASAETVIVHLLAEEHWDAAALFSTSGADRFADESTWERIDTGEPVLTLDATRIRGRIAERMTFGGSIVLAVEVLDVTLPERPADSLVYYDRAWHSLAAHPGSRV